MKQLLYALICISILNISCKKEQEKPIKPVAEFVILGQDFTAPCVVTFENKSKNSNQYHWDYGDGAESFQFTPEIIQTKTSYFEAGTYTLTLVAGGQGYISTFKRQITIKP